MKRRDLIRTLRLITTRHGLTVALKEGGNHTKAQIGTWKTTVPRHREIDETLAKAIIRNCESTLQENS
ncbi:hypothetical protein [Schaalia vaccimaxillae]|uniref:hypothetical protein n=1 Tax=Schaalia vaccimaxillae TaxID=183916 RepID=UPI0003B3A7F1|nr:hypothetical protein [Schaalia vaccimaxillae]